MRRVTKKTTKEITKEMRAEMITLVGYDRDWLAGIESVEGTADDWLSYGFAADTVVPWWDAGCFDAKITARCNDAGLCPDELAKPSDHYGMTIGYAICNLDMSISEAVRRTTWARTS